MINLKAHCTIHRRTNVDSGLVSLNDNKADSSTTSPRDVLIRYRHQALIHLEMIHRLTY